MRIATWNVNSLKARMERVEEWLSYAQPDILCLQETKLSDAAFPSLAFAGLGYESVHHGDGRWNGVAILSRLPIRNATSGFSDDVEDEAVESRFISAMCGDIEVCSVYVPNGRIVDSEFFAAKLVWLDRLRSFLDSRDPRDPIAICGDFNIAPENRDVWNPAKASGGTHVTDVERKALRAIQEWGLADVFRDLYSDDKLFTWWDYRAGDFHSHRGMRIDLILATRVLAQRARFGLIDRNARKGKSPSDHAPLFIDVED